MLDQILTLGSSGSTTFASASHAFPPFFPFPFPFSFPLPPLSLSPPLAASPGVPLSLAAAGVALAFAALGCVEEVVPDAAAGLGNWSLGSRRRTWSSGTGKPISGGRAWMDRISGQ